MAFLLTPRFAPAYQQQQCGPFGFCAPSRPTYAYRQVSRPQRQSFPSFAPFLSQVDELLTELDREARREAHRQRQQRKRAFRARFDVRENKDGYQVDGEVPGFEQEHISIEVTDEHTLKIAGNTEWAAPLPTQEQLEAAPAVEAEKPAEVEKTQEDQMDGVTLNEPEQETASVVSDNESHKSYQATVEDDFEDLGAETSSTISASSSLSTPAEPKGKEKVVDEPTETAVAPQPQPEAPAQQQEHENREWLSERVHGSFERTFRFPERIDATNVSASLKNGVLTITVPKAQAPEIRRITIQ